MSRSREPQYSLIPSPLAKRLVSAIEKHWHTDQSFGPLALLQMVERTLRQHERTVPGRFASGEVVLHAPVSSIEMTEQMGKVSPNVGLVLSFEEKRDAETLRQLAHAGYTLIAMRSTPQQPVDPPQVTKDRFGFTHPEERMKRAVLEIVRADAGVERVMLALREACRRCGLLQPSVIPDELRTLGSEVGYVCGECGRMFGSGSKEPFICERCKRGYPPIEGASAPSQ